MSVSDQSRYSKRWKRWVGCYLLLGGALGVATEIPKVSIPPSMRDLIFLAVEGLFMAWGIWWIAGNPKAKEAPSQSRGDRPSRGIRIALAIALLAVALMVYQLFFMPR